jgi:hypothetical protein
MRAIAGPGLEANLLGARAFMYVSLIDILVYESSVAMENVLLPMIRPLIELDV